MDLATLEKSAHVAPLLVRLYDSQRIYLQGGSRRQIAHEELTATASELITAPLSDREQELVTDVLLALVRQAEIDLRQALADRLAVLDNAPLRLVLKLAHDDILVARNLLRSSPVLNDLDLLYLIKAKDPMYWQEIAKRTSIGEIVIDALADQRDDQTARNLAANQQIKLSNHAYRIMTEMAQFDPELAQPLLLRRDVPEVVARVLYKFVGDKLQNYITERFDESATADVQEAVKDVVAEFAIIHRPASLQPTVSMLRAARAYEEQGQLQPATMVRTLKRGQIAAFIAMLAIKAKLDPSTVVQMITQHSGQALAVACRAIEFGKNDFMQFYLLTQRARTEDGVVNQAQFAKALHYFDTITQASALAILSASQVEP